MLQLSVSRGSAVEENPLTPPTPLSPALRENISYAVKGGWKGSRVSGGLPCFLPERPRNCYFYLRQGLTFRERVWYHMGSRLNDYFRSLLNEVNYDCQCQTV